MAILLRDFEPIEESDFCIQSVGGLVEMNGESPPDPERTNKEEPYFSYPRSNLDPAGLLRDDRVSRYWIEICFWPWLLGLIPKEAGLGAPVRE